MNILELQAEQIKEVINIKQIFMSYIDASDELLKYQGCMRWRHISGGAYLYNKNRGGAWKSLGPISEKTESIYNNFVDGKSKAEDRLRSLGEQLRIRSRIAKAVGINRIPLTTSRIINSIRREGIHDKIMVIGTNAIYAYESMSSVFVMPALMETGDVDFLWDNRSELKLISNDSSPDFLSILQKADKSFKRTNVNYRAANKNGFMVDLVVEEPKNMMGETRNRIGGYNDLIASEIGSLRWLINSPSIDVTVIDQRGLPLIMRVPNPRSFAIHKLWLSEQPSRSTGKAKRDMEQAYTVASMVVQYMPQYSFSKDELKMFPEEVVREGLGKIEDELDW